MRRTKTVKIPAITVTWAVFKDSTRDERYPWVLEINGETWNEYKERGMAIEAADEVIKGHYIDPVVRKAWLAATQSRTGKDNRHELSDDPSIENNPQPYDR
jgi:hypothetical protein